MGTFEGQTWDSHGLRRMHTSFAGATCMFEILPMNKTSASTANARVCGGRERRDVGADFSCRRAAASQYMKIQKDGAGVWCQLINIWVFMIHAAAVVLSHSVCVEYSKVPWPGLRNWEIKWSANMQGKSSMNGKERWHFLFIASQGHVHCPGRRAHTQLSPADRAQPGAANSGWQLPEGLGGRVGGHSRSSAAAAPWASSAVWRTPCAGATQSWRPRILAAPQRRRGGTRPSRCQWLSRRTPARS